MIRIPRICLVLGLSFVLLAATVPAAHARSLTKSQSSSSSIGSWLDATLAWVGSLVTGAPHGKAPHGSKLTSTSGTGGTGYAQPMTGSCIDPWG
ncbi:MAG: hypothetical protein ACJ76N_06595, partial [Thermoanaerobaculia bacterium]